MELSSLKITRWVLIFEDPDFLPIDSGTWVFIYKLDRVGKFWW